MKEHIGDTTLKHDGELTIVHEGKKTYTNTHGDVTTDLKDGKYEIDVNGDYVTDVYGTRHIEIKGDKLESLVGNYNGTCSGKYAVDGTEIMFTAVEDFITISKEGNIIFQGLGTGLYTSKGIGNPNKVRGGIIFNGNYLKRSGKGDPGGLYVYEYDPSQTELVPPVKGVVDNTGDEIHHNYGYIPNLEYDKNEA